VNEKFADALLEEIAREQSPLVLVQDYISPSSRH